MFKTSMPILIFPTKSWQSSTKAVLLAPPDYGVGTQGCRPIRLASSSEHMFGFVRGFLAGAAERGQRASSGH